MLKRFKNFGALFLLWLYLGCFILITGYFGEQNPQKWSIYKTHMINDRHMIHQIVFDQRSWLLKSRSVGRTTVFYRLWTIIVFLLLEILQWNSHSSERYNINFYTEKLKVIHLHFLLHDIFHYSKSWSKTSKLIYLLPLYSVTCIIFPLSLNKYKVLLILLKNN